ncbi:hypothetical protein B0H10DRAFT_2004048 [Mycena sp. CBHHK59/15]|nr:hypothetical protein B0H10DRAFT_2004048 [Mycena sp. CBHHK59/15]
MSDHNGDPKFISLNVVHCPRDGPQKPPTNVIVDDTNRFWHRAASDHGLTIETLVPIRPTSFDSVPSENSRKTDSTGTSETGSAFVGRQTHSLTTKMGSMSLHKAPQISVHAQSRSASITVNVPQLDMPYFNDRGYGEPHVWILKIGAHRDDDLDFTTFSRLRIDTGSKSLMVFNTPRPLTWDPATKAVLPGYHGFRGAEHWEIDTKIPAFTQLTATQRAATGEEVIPKLVKYEGGTMCCMSLLLFSGVCSNILQLDTCTKAILVSRAMCTGLMGDLISTQFRKPRSVV